MIIKLSLKLGIKVGCESAKVELEYRVETQTEGEVEIGMETQCEGQDVEVKMGRGANEWMRECMSPSLCGPSYI